MTVAPLTLGHTAELVCAAPAEDDELVPDAPLAMPAMPGIDVDPELDADPDVLELDPDPEPEPEPAPFDAGAVGAAEELVAAWDVASDTVVAASTSTAAMPTAVSAAHHILAARLRADQRWVIRSLRRSIALLLAICSWPASTPDVRSERRGC